MLSEKKRTKAEDNMNKSGGPEKGKGELLPLLWHSSPSHLSGAAGNRTLYLSHAKRALYHMSYNPAIGNNTAIPAEIILKAENIASYPLLHCGQPGLAIVLFPHLC